MRTDRETACFTTFRVKDIRASQLWVGSRETQVHLAWIPGLPFHDRRACPR